MNPAKRLDSRGEKRGGNINVNLRMWEEKKVKEKKGGLWYRGSPWGKVICRKEEGAWGGKKKRKATPASVRGIKSLKTGGERRKKKKQSPKKKALPKEGFEKNSRKQKKEKCEKRSLVKKP